MKPKILLLIFTVNVCSTLAQEFDKNHVGVSFSPYVKRWEGENIPAWNSYNVYDVQAMLKLIATKFHHIATYGIGVSKESLTKPWDQGDSNAVVARAASMLNQQNNKTLISIAQGIHQSDNLEIFHREIDVAFEAAKESNARHPGTVWALILTNQYVIDPIRGEHVLQLLAENHEKAAAAGLKMGVRTNTCGHLLNNGVAKSSIEKLARASDFIMCNVHPSVVDQGVEESINVIAQEFTQLKTALRALNPQLQVILGDSGWPSKGYTTNNSTNNIHNLKKFWLGMNDWAAKSKNKIYLFEAFDEPWKSDVRDSDRKSPTGRYGGEGHYGWWKRIGNYNTQPNSYVEKVGHEEPDVDSSASSSDVFNKYSHMLYVLLGFYVFLV